MFVIIWYHQLKLSRIINVVAGLLIGAYSSIIWPGINKGKAGLIDDNDVGRLNYWCLGYLGLWPVSIIPDYLAFFNNVMCELISFAGRSIIVLLRITQHHSLYFWNYQGLLAKTIRISSELPLRNVLCVVR